MSRPASEWLRLLGGPQARHSSLDSNPKVGAEIYSLVSISWIQSGENRKLSDVALALIGV